MLTGIYLLSLQTVNKVTLLMGSYLFCSSVMQIGRSSVMLTGMHSRITHSPNYLLHPFQVDNRQEISQLRFQPFISYIIHVC